MDMPAPIHASDAPMTAVARAVAWLSCLTIALLPILSARVPPLVDYPSHLARQFILANYQRMPALQLDYAIDWGVKPNLAMDAVVPILARWVPIETAGQLFLAATLLGLVGGTAALSRALHGRVGLLPMASTLFLYNLALLLGLINFLASAGLALAAFAWWIGAERWPFLSRGLVFAFLSAVIFFAHLFPLAVFFVAVAAYEAGRWRASGRIPLPALAAATLALMPAAILWTLKPAGPPAASFAFGNAEHRAASLLAATIFARPSDLVILAAALLAVAAAIRSARGNALAPSMRLPLAVLVVVTLIMPRRMIGGDDIDLRLPVLLPFLLLASLPPQLLPARLTKPFVAAVLALLALRSGDVALSWHSMERDFTELRRATRAIAPGARVLTVQDVDEGGRGMLYQHAIELGILERCIFVPQMAKLPDQQPVLPAASVAAIDGGTATPVNLREFALGADKAASAQLLARPFRGWERPYYANWPANFDYVVHLHPGRPAADALRPDLLVRVTDGTFFEIYRVRGRPQGLSAGCQPG